MSFLARNKEKDKQIKGLKLRFDDAEKEHRQRMEGMAAQMRKDERDDRIKALEAQSAPRRASNHTLCMPCRARTRDSVGHAAASLQSPGYSRRSQPACAHTTSDARHATRGQSASLRRRRRTSARRSTTKAARRSARRPRRRAARRRRPTRPSGWPRRRRARWRASRRRKRRRTRRWRRPTTRRPRRAPRRCWRRPTPRRPRRRRWSATRSGSSIWSRRAPQP